MKSKEEQYYDIFSLPAGSEVDKTSLKKKYKELIKRCHPDRNKSRKANQDTALLNEAFHYFNSAARKPAADKRSKSSAAYKIPRLKGNLLKKYEAEKKHIKDLIELLRTCLFDYYAFGLNNMTARKSGYSRHKYYYLNRHFNVLTDDFSRIRRSSCFSNIARLAGIYNSFLVSFNQGRSHDILKNCFESTTDYLSYKLYRDGCRVLDAWIYRMIAGLISVNSPLIPAARRDTAEKCFKSLVFNYPKSYYAELAKIRLQILGSFSRLAGNQ